MCSIVLCPAPQGPVWLPALKSLFFTSNRYQAGSCDPAEDGSPHQRIDMYLLATDTGEVKQVQPAVAWGARLGRALHSTWLPNCATLCVFPIGPRGWHHCRIPACTYVGPRLQPSGDGSYWLVWSSWAAHGLLAM